MTDTICQGPTAQQGMKGMECFKVQLKNGLGEVCPACWDTVGAPADATHDTFSHFMIIWVASLTALILKDYPG